MNLSHLVFKALLPALLLSFSTLELSASRAPQHVIFTYMGDPSTTLTANWQSILTEPATTLTEGCGEAIVYYDTVSHGGVFSKYASRAKGIASQIEGLEDRFTYRVELTYLKPDTTYYLVVGNPITGVSVELKVKTILQDDSALRFVTGGDMGTSEDTRTLLKHAASYSPDFAVIGGDIAYANGNLKSVGNWDIWLNYYTEQMVTSEGYSIPVVFAIGNHETQGHFGKTKKNAPFYFGFFGQDTEQSHFVRKFGQNLVLYVLDSGHVASHASQVDWMRTQFEANVGVKYQAAVYHVPLYPSHRDFMGQHSVAGKTHWAPVFDEFDLTVAFENHDHTFKRTHLIKDGVATGDATGTLYLGDGCWGRDVRSIDYDQRWYLDAVGSIQHFWVVDMNAEQAVYRAVDIENRIFDVYPETEPGAAAAATRLASKDQTYRMHWNTVRIDGYHDVEEQWLGGVTTVALQNSFDFPITAQLKAMFPEEFVVTVGFSDEPITLAAGEKQQLSVSFVPKQGLPVKRAQILKKLMVKVNFILEDPAHAEPVQFSQTYAVPVRAKKVEAPKDTSKSFTVSR